MLSASVFLLTRAGTGEYANGADHRNGQEQQALQYAPGARLDVVDMLGYERRGDCQQRRRGNSGGPPA
jgi:hypothetical protein